MKHKNVKNRKPFLTMKKRENKEVKKQKNNKSLFLYRFL